MIVRGLESAAKGMVALMDMNDRIANNLSNVNTVGFKKGELRFKDVMQSAVYSQEGSISIHKKDGKIRKQDYSKKAEDKESK